MTTCRKAQNPIIWADVPDPSVIRVGDTYYMTSTTMHMNPGVPIMKAKDLVNWEIVNYVYDVLGEDERQRLINGRNEYGLGSWASSLRYHNGLYYVVFSSRTAGQTFIFRTPDLEKGPWEKSTIEFIHDMSLLFDDDGRVYLVYGSGDIKLLELTEEARAVKPGGLNQVIIPEASAIAGPDIALPAEGAHIHKLGGKYYIFLITWPQGGMRTQLCYRADEITGPYEGRVVLQDAGIAQGGLVDTPDGKWYALLFGDRGAVGRIPYLVPVTWEAGWPVFGIDGKVPRDTGLCRESKLKIVASDEFEPRAERIGAYHTAGKGKENDDNGSNLALVWQWNHNPDHDNWSLTERPGYLRLRTGQLSTGILEARNTLTQRTFGPECSAVVAVEVGKMQDGDYAGLAVLQKHYGLVGVKRSGSAKAVVMVDGTAESAVEVDRVQLAQDRVYLKIECDFREERDKAYFYYSLDGLQWKTIGHPVKMSYTIPHFMGYRFALFNYATKKIGGYVDFDYYRISDQMLGTGQ